MNLIIPPDVEQPFHLQFWNFEQIGMRMYYINICSLSKFTNDLYRFSLTSSGSRQQISSFKLSFLDFNQTYVMIKISVSSQKASEVFYMFLSATACWSRSYGALMPLKIKEIRHQWGHVYLKGILSLDNVTHAQERNGFCFTDISIKENKQCQSVIYQ